MSIFKKPMNPLGLEALKPLSFDKHLHTLNPIFTSNFNQDPTSDIIIQTILGAKNFVHFATYSIDRYFEGILKAVSSKDSPVVVRGVIGNIEIL
ncbi:MAG: hypothetical protein RMJ29_06350 [Candidatus Bipolaricaulota bacterium]|nr:hypothetical protein [Candidatus Bipolaricaulota bacterium]